MIKIFKSTKCILCTLVSSIFFFTSCSNDKRNDVRNEKINKINSQKDSMVISLLYSLIDAYEPSKEYEFYFNKVQYNVGNRLSNLFSKQNPNNWLNDSNYRKPVLYLLEKKYLYIVKNAKNKNASNIGNLTTWWGERTYMQYALNVFSKIQVNYGENYNAYIVKIRDIVCIDSIVAEASRYAIENKNHSLIHKSCLRFIPSNCTNMPQQNQINKTFDKTK